MALYKCIKSISGGGVFRFKLRVECLTKPLASYSLISSDGCIEVE